ncbi:zinc homeostasis factor 1 [Nilaparvata lugens]|uniref:zinc homeostasis factor 1 n=1 Tax=Nilaparvata lugens TaxID=108931 RepID=UPI00193CBA4A|nr:zinc homeostasis factor 1 [Nilaparvata lugens]
MAAIKEWFQRMRPLRVCILLALTTAYFVAQLFVSHLTHALTLLVDSYHVLCNIIALVGCIITIKYGRSSGEITNSQESSVKTGSEELKVLSTPLGSVKFAPQDLHQPERELRNTFGWARIDILVMLINCVFLASLCFSVLVEAVQTLIHISHHDEMHHPIPVFCVGLVGVLINLLCYVMIGGYTYHQGSFLHVTETGDVVLESVDDKSLAYGQRRLSAQTRKHNTVPLTSPKRQGLWETTRDVIGCVIVLLCSVIVYLTDESVAKYVDPALSILSAVLLLYFSSPYMKESCLILLQTIPDHINIDSLESELLLKFKDIVNVHDFHVWQLTLDKTFSTVHIIFQNPHDYIRITDDITNFFHEHGITHVTVQPEFYKDLNSVDLVSGKGTAQCLVQCLRDECLDSHCCSSKDDLRTISIQNLTSKKMIREDEPVKILNIKNIADESFINYDQTRNFQSCMNLENTRKNENSNGKTNGSLKGSISVPDIEKKLHRTSNMIMNNGNGYAVTNGVQNGSIDKKLGEMLRKTGKEIEETVHRSGRSVDPSRKSGNLDEKNVEDAGKFSEGEIKIKNSCSQTSINVIIRDAGEEVGEVEREAIELNQSESGLEKASQSESGLEKSDNSESEKTVKE